MNAYRLGVVAFAVVGLCYVIEAAHFIGVNLALFGMGTESMPAGYAWTSVSIPLVAGVVLFAAREPIARRLFLRGEDAPPGEVMPPLVDLQAVAIAVVAVYVLLDNTWRALRVALPMLGYGTAQTAPLTDLVPDVLTVGVGIVLFLRARRIASWWCCREGVAL